MKLEAQYLIKANMKSMLQLHKYLQKLKYLKL